MWKSTSFRILVSMVLLCGISAAYVVMAESPERRQAHVKQQTEETKTHLQRIANMVINDVCYMKDPRTDLCFAYCWGGDGRGGPALTCVPCDSIPPELLFVAEIK